MSTEIVKRLRKAEKRLTKMLKDIEKGKYEKYKFKNIEEAKAYKTYIEEKLQEFRKRIKK